MDYTNQGQGQQPYYGRPSEGSTAVAYSEKPAQDSKSPDKSKRFIFRMVRLGASLALTIAVLVLTIIILAAGRHGDGSSDLSLITVSDG